MSIFNMGGTSYPAFSGYGSHKSRRSTACVANAGAIPPGAYYIVDRRSGGRFGALRDRLHGKTDWFALYADDGRIDDHTLCEEIERGNFRLHPKGPRGISRGCITIESRSDYRRMFAMLKSREMFTIPDTSLLAYGKVVVR